VTSLSFRFPILCNRQSDFLYFTILFFAHFTTSISFPSFGLTILLLYFSSIHCFNYTIPLFYTSFESLILRPSLSSSLPLLLSLHFLHSLLMPAFSLTHPPPLDHSEASPDARRSPTQHHNYTTIPKDRSGFNMMLPRLRRCT